MNNPITQLEQLTLTSASKNFLRETAKWTFFLSVLGFIMIGLILIFAAFASKFVDIMQMSYPQPLPKGIGVSLTITYLILAIIYFFPVYYLLQFSNKMKKALSTKNDEILAKAFESLKSHYKFIGVFIIITLSLYILLIAVSLMGVL